VKRFFFSWLPLILVIILVVGIFMIRRSNAQNISIQANVSGSWTFYFKIPPQRNVSVAYYQGKSISPSEVLRFEQVGNVIWIPDAGKGGMGYVNDKKVHFAYLLVPVIDQKRIFVLYTFDGILSKNEKSMHGHFNIQIYGNIIKGGWEAVKNIENGRQKDLKNSFSLWYTSSRIGA